MRAVRFLQFLIECSFLFNVSWISWNVGVHASGGVPPLLGDGAHMANTLELNDTQTRVVHLSDSTITASSLDKTEVMVHTANTTVDHLGDQTSALTTSKKPHFDETVDKAVVEGVTTERSNPEFSGNEENLTGRTIAQTEISETVAKGEERKSVSSTEVGFYGEVTTSVASTSDESSVSRIDSQRSDETDITADEVTKEVTSAMSASESNTEQSTPLPWLSSSVASAGKTGSVTDVQLIALSTSELRLTWKKTGFYSHVSFEDKVLNLSNVSYVFGSLIPGQLYNASVSACYEQHQCSNPQIVTNNTYPKIPENVTLTAFGADWFELQWYQSGVASNFTITVADAVDQHILFDQHILGEWNSTEIRQNISYSFTQSSILNVTIKACSGELCVCCGRLPSQTDLIELINISSVNTTNESVTLQWFQFGIATNISVHVTIKDRRHGGIEPESWNSTIYPDGTVWNWTWVSIVIPNLPIAGQKYASEIQICWSRCRTVPYEFQTAPSDPADIKVYNVSTESAIVSWAQKGFADSFRISVSDQSATVFWRQDTAENTSNIDNLSTPGQLLFVTVTALSGQMWSNSQTITFNLRPSKPDSLFLSECHDNNLCIKWNQSGIFDSYAISLNGSKANFSCSNSSDTTANLTTAVCCTVYHDFFPGLLTTLTVAVESGNQRSDEGILDHMKNPAMPQDLHMVTANTSMVCVIWTQTGFYDSFNILVSLGNHSFEENVSIPINNVQLMGNGTVQHCINDLPCPAAAYSLQVAAVSRGKNSSFQNLEFYSAPTLDSVVKCDSQTNESLTLSIQQGVENDSCPSLEDNVLFQCIYKPVTNESCFDKNDITEKACFLNENDTIDVTGLDAGVTYQVTVWKVLKSVDSEKAVIQCTTEPNSPTEPYILEVSSTYMKLNWMDPKGCVADFLVQCLGRHNDTKTDSRNVTEKKGACENLTPGALYNVTVSSRQRHKDTILQSKPETLKFVTVPMPPSSVTVSSNLVNSVQLTVTYSSLHCTHFHFKGNGINETELCNSETHNLASLQSNTLYNIEVFTISDYHEGRFGTQISLNATAVLVWTLPQAVTNFSVDSSTTTSLRLRWTQTDDSEKGTLEYILTLTNTSGYQLTKTLNCSSSMLNCTHGRMLYEIKNLASSTNYTITIQASNPGGVGDKQMIQGQTKEDRPVNETLSLPFMIAGLSTVVLLIILLIVVILFLLLRKKPQFAVPSSKRPSDMMGFPNPSFSPILESAEVCERMKPQPILLENFIEHLEELHKDSDLRFSAEYALLTELSPKHPQTAAELEENRIKNRYSNILPFDHSRVKLIPLDDDDRGSDYINASFMPGYVSKREFIAAQGPMKSTVDEFWRMIWEQHCTTIVMVTNLQERGREKCAEYWPTDDEPVFYGDLQVQLKSESQLNYYIIRILDVKLGEKKRVIKHLHFIAWPDFGCPENTTVLIDFVLGVRAHASCQPSQGSGPILVHCSAGVGRTGTFIIVDHLLQHMRTHKTMDIFGLVLSMRNYRCNMIQTEAQYIFAHECIKTAIERQMISSVMTSGADDEDDECLYQNVSRKEKSPEDDECVYQNCPVNNVQSIKL